MKDKISLLKKRTIDEKTVSGDETKEKERKSWELLYHNLEKHS